MPVMNLKSGRRASLAMAETEGKKRRRGGVLVRAVVVVRVQHRAVVETLVRAGGADEDAGVGEVNSQRSSPGIDELTFVVQIGFGADDDNDVLFVLALKRFADFEVAADGVGADAF